MIRRTLPYELLPPAIPLLAMVFGWLVPTFVFGCLPNSKADDYLIALYKSTLITTCAVALLLTAVDKTAKLWERFGPLYKGLGLAGAYCINLPLALLLYYLAFPQFHEFIRLDSAGFFAILYLIMLVFDFVLLFLLGLARY